MNRFTYYVPTKVVFGKGTNDQAGPLCKECGAQKVLIVYGSDRIVADGLLGEIESSILGESLKCLSIGGVVPNPLLSKALEIAERARAFEPDCIVGIGGGSVLDTAKTVGLILANPDVDIWAFYLGKIKLTRRIPVGAITTISAAGSEMSNNAVLTNDLQGGLKISSASDLNRCIWAIMDPALTYTTPKYQIASGAADIWLHTSERYFIDKQSEGNHLTDEIAEGVMRNIIKWGPIGVSNPANEEAMSEIMWTSSISHNSLTGLGAGANWGREGDWSCHQLGMALGALYNVTHGPSMTAIWKSWALYGYKNNVERFSGYARHVLGLSGNDEELALHAIDATVEWFRALGLPVNLTELLQREITDDMLRDMALTASYGNKRKFGKLRVLDCEDMYNIYKGAIR